MSLKVHIVRELIVVVEAVEVCTRALIKSFKKAGGEQG